MLTGQATSAPTVRRLPVELIQRASVGPPRAGS
jgi:LacI family transcriptional regulator